MLRQHHQTIERLFKRFENAGDRAYVSKREIVDRIIEELAMHAAVEEQVFYPAVRSSVPDTEDMTLESLEEHHVVKWLLAELDGMDPRHERFDAKVTVLMENVRHHVEEEEHDLFPKVRDAMGRNALADLGTAMTAAKKTAPTHPHPRSPDTPPGNGIVGAVSGVVDRINDNLCGIAQGSVTAAQDVISKITRSGPPKTSPTGSSVARGRAKDVRSAAAEATDAVEQTARAARSGASRTARAASSGVKGTATTAKRSGRSVSSSAKRAATTTRRTAAPRRSAPRPPPSGERPERSQPPRADGPQVSASPASRTTPASSLPHSEGL